MPPIAAPTIETKKPKLVSKKGLHRKLHDKWFADDLKLPAICTQRKNRLAFCRSCHPQLDESGRKLQGNDSAFDSSAIHHKARFAVADLNAEECARNILDADSRNVSFGHSRKIKQGRGLGFRAYNFLGQRIPSMEEILRGGTHESQIAGSCRERPTRIIRVVVPVPLETKMLSVEFVTTTRQTNRSRR